MSATTNLRKMEEDIEKYELELKALRDAMPVDDACRNLAETISKTPEPLDSAHKKDNPWTAPIGGGGCCTVM